MDIQLLCIGDVVGRPGLHAVSEALPGLVHEHAVDCVIANVENAAAGSGLTPGLYEKFLKHGVHLMTMGDHALRRQEIYSVLDKSDRLARPGNLPGEAPGRGLAVYRTSRGPGVAVITVMGRLFMKPPVDCPYHTVEHLLAEMPPDVKIVVVEIHAEATSEKVAMGWHLDGRVSVVFGTHTHIPTADESVLPGGTAYISDLGMTGPYDSVLGRRKDRVLRHLMTALPSPFDVATDDIRLCGVLVKVDAASGRARSIERIRIDVEPPSDAG